LLWNLVGTFIRFSIDRVKTWSVKVICRHTHTHTHTHTHSANSFATDSVQCCGSLCSVLFHCFEAASHFTILLCLLPLSPEWEGIPNSFPRRNRFVVVTEERALRYILVWLQISVRVFVVEIVATALHSVHKPSASIPSHSLP
jgi:hypothetical protein